MPRTATFGFSVEYLNSKQASKLFGVSRRTVAKWFDAKLVAGFRMPSGHRERRYSLPSCVEFAKQHGIPIDVGSLPPRFERGPAA